MSIRAYGLIVILCLTSLIYALGLPGGYVFDDYPNILDNLDLQTQPQTLHDWLTIAFSTGSGVLGRPVSHLTFALNYQVFGLDPLGFKLINILIHLCNTSLIFVLAQRIIRNLRYDDHTDVHLPLLVAALWALTPLQLTSVLYVIQRETALSALFVLLGLNTYLHARERHSAFQRFATLVFYTALASLAKESGALLPLYAAVLEATCYRFQNKHEKADMETIIGFCICLLAPMLIGMVYLLPTIIDGRAYAGRSFTLSERLMTETRVLWHYLGNLVIPRLSELSLYHDDLSISRNLLAPITTLVSILGLLILSAVAWVFRKRSPLITLGVLWFFAGHAMESTIIPLELMFEHRNYLPSFGIALAIFGVLAEVQSAKTRIYIALALIFFHASLTALRAYQWHDPLLFAAIEAKENPNSPRATYELGRLYLMLAQKNPEAREPAKTALEYAASLPGSSLLAEAALLRYASSLNIDQEPIFGNAANKLMSRPIKVEDTSALYTLVGCINEQRCAIQPSDLRTLLDAGLRSPSVTAEYYSVYANFELNAGENLLHGEQLILESIRRAPKELRYRMNLINLYLVTGRYHDAQLQLDAMRRVDTLGRYRAEIRSAEMKANNEKVNN